jgi:predicted nucleic acid-binding protein
MSDKIFVDTNLWIYAHLEESGNDKSATAFSLLQPVENFVVSTQVLSEYYSIMLKNNQTDEWIQHNLNIILNACTVASVAADTVRLTHQIRLRYRFSYWDSQIIASALECGCRLLYSEDMQHDQVIEDTLRIHNPFKKKPGV